MAGLSTVKEVSPIVTLTAGSYPEPGFGKRYVPRLPFVNPEKLPVSPPTTTVVWAYLEGNNTTRLPLPSDTGFQTAPVPKAPNEVIPEKVVIDPPPPPAP